MQAIVANLPIGKGHLDKYCQSQQSDAVYAQIIEYCKSGWPDTGEFDLPSLPDNSPILVAKGGHYIPGTKSHPTRSCG